MFERILLLGIFSVKVIEYSQKTLNTMMGNIQIMKRFVEKIAFLGLSPTKVSSVAIKLTENLEACYID